MIRNRGINSSHGYYSRKYGSNAMQLLVVCNVVDFVICMIPETIITLIVILLFLFIVLLFPFIVERMRLQSPSRGIIEAS